MEILFELVLQIIVFIAEALFSVVGEILFSILESLFDWKRSKAVPKSEPRQAGPVLQALGYAAFGAICGLVTLWLAPSHFIVWPWLRWLNFLVAPVIAGFALVLWRGWFAMDKKADSTRAFINGAALAFALGGVRLMFAR